MRSGFSRCWTRAAKPRESNSSTRLALDVGDADKGERATEHDALGPTVRNTDAMHSKTAPLKSRRRAGSSAAGVVGRGAVDDQLDRAVQDLLPVGERGVGRFEQPLDLMGLGRDPLLFGPQQVDVDGVLSSRRP